MPQTTISPQLVLNKMTKAQFEATTKDPGQFYFVTDEDQFLPGSTKYGKFVDLGLDSTSLVVTLKDQDNTALSSKSLDLSSLGFLTNTATGTNSLTILGYAASQQGCVNIGIGSSTNNSTFTTVIGAAASIGNNASYSISIGAGANVVSGAESSIAIGCSSSSRGIRSICIGYGASSRKAFSIQLGAGNNNEENSFYVATSNSNNWKMLGSDGKIPDDRLNTTIARTSALPSVATTSTLGLVKPDGTTITIDSNGVISSQGGGNYLPLSGGTMTGNISMNDNSILFGSQTASGGSGIVVSSGYLCLGYYSSSVSKNVSPLWCFSPGSGDIFPNFNGLDICKLGRANNRIGTIYTTKLYNTNVINVPEAGGTMALTSDLPSIATTSTAGLVKPDGTTVTVDANGVISAQGGQQYAMVITDYTAS